MRKHLCCLEDTVVRDKAIKGNSGWSSERRELYRGFLFLENTYHHEQNTGRTCIIKGTSGAVSDGKVDPIMGN